MLQDLVLAAVNDARAKVEEKLKGSLGGLGRRHARRLSLSAACDAGTLRRSPMIEYTPPAGPPDRGTEKDPRHRPQVGPADRLLPAAHRQEECAGPGRGHRPGPREDLLLLASATTSPPSTPARSAPTPERDGEKICVVEEPFNIHSIEKTGLFHGHYHVLMGNLSPIRGIGPDELRIAGLDRARPRREISARSSWPPARPPRAAPRPII